MKTKLIILSIITLLILIYVVVPKIDLPFVTAKLDSFKIEIIEQAKAEKLEKEKTIKELKEKLLFLEIRKTQLTECIKYNSWSLNTISEPKECWTFTWEEPWKIIVNKIKKKEVKKELSREVRLMSWNFWRVNPEWKSQNYFHLNWRNPIERTNDLLRKFWQENNPWLKIEDEYKVKRWILVCIAKADTSLWKELKTKNNFWNVWNNDNWDKVHISTPKKWIEAIWQTLNNKYLWYKQSIWSLSSGWGWTDPIYATSPHNWNNNVINCLRLIYDDDKIDENFMFRK